MRSLTTLVVLAVGGGMSMVTRRLFAVFVLLLLLTASSARANQQADESQVRTVTDQLYAALRKGDSAVLDRLLAEDFFGIHGNGTTDNKSTYLAKIRSGAFTYQRYDARDTQVHTYGDTAVVYALVTFSGNAGGKQFSDVDIRVTRIWVRKKGEWRCVEYQVTRVL